jgi:protein-S-isoprenylcysteine O-methyltransferase Ste14
MEFVDIRPPRIALALVATAAALHGLMPVARTVVFAAPGIGAALALAGFAVMIRGRWLFRRHRVAICPTAPTARLIEHDVYRVTRNPMYLGMTGMLAGLAIGVGSLPFHVAALAFFIVMDRVFLPFEEAKLAASFGGDYDAYRARTSRWI